ncbi:hypothetical protein [Priestia aryabhattai]|uniref:hypothetical protein n=1 Tax=Priestia aryabhattai TaxID=412384 RepID=UPI000BFD0A84|nr:hypothetical protein [Priestia aryabhattai]PHF65859.1 hypothetical protein COI42_23415 [Priestia aryabhattai]
MSVNRTETQRFNMYLSQQLVDGLDKLGEQINVSNNALINVAISDYLLQREVIENLSEENVKQHKILKETDYCQLVEQGRLEKEDHVSTVERIFVKEKGEYEIRFAYYKPNKKNNERLVLRPLDLNEDDLYKVLMDAIDKDVFTDNFLNKLKTYIEVSQKNKAFK